MDLGAQRLGAKFRPNPEGGALYHPLACHLVDVAAVALALWDDCLPAQARATISDALGLPDAQARQWAAFIAGLHDLGKASRPWQAKYDKDHATRLAGTDLSASVRTPDPGHGIVTAALLPALLEARGVPFKLANDLASVSGGHHGVFRSPGRFEGQGGDIGEERAEVRAAWDAARQQLFDELAAVLQLGPPPQGTLSNTAMMVLGGFITIADWIGSIDDTGFFEYSTDGPADLAAYFGRSRDIAGRALDVLGWRAYPAPRRRSFEEAFGTPERAFTPRPLQRQVEALRVEHKTPKLVIIEAPMGEGKTEAALHLLEGWTADQAARGFYLALPTQATANQMHGRVRDFLRGAFAPELRGGGDVNLVLAHGGAWLNDDVDHLPSRVYGEDGPQDGSVGAGAWFLAGKRALLAPYGVGTIDQALMAVLQVRHVFLRLHGLAGKAVVIDEVHAYDTYMTGLLERLLEWLGALGSPVVLLSATLPTGRRRQLAEAYLRGQGAVAAPGDVEAVASVYPRITWVEDGAVRSESFLAAPRSRRQLVIDKIDDGPAAVVAVLEEQLANGGCAVVICNTVARAQEMYAALEGSAFEHERLLFHARFLAQDRQAIERRCLAMFGPPRGEGVERPGRFVLVATQVVEQSLDVSFDVMVTDFAPVDLLLQRSGRLKRHQEVAAEGEAATLHVRWPEEDGGVPRFDGASTYVYDEHILLRTWQTLRGRDAVNVPEDIQELVDAVYSDDGQGPPDAAEALTARWELTWEDLQVKKLAEQREAKDRTMRTPTGRVGSPSDFQKHSREDDSPELHPALQALTRLADPSVDVVLLPEGSALLPEGKRAPGRDEVRELLLRSVSVASRLAVHRLFEQEPPEAWKASAALRRHRLLVLDGNGEARVNGSVFTYDERVGLRIVPQSP